MDDFTATMIAEGVIEVGDCAEYLDAWQHLIDTGLAWRLQGWFGRTASALIDQGICTEPYTMADKINDEFINGTV